jgi:hypothetical protein
MVVLKNITLTFPLKSSYLIESTTDSTTLQIYLPTITSTTQLGAETTFIKTSGIGQSFFSGSLQPFVIPNYTTGGTTSGTTGTTVMPAMRVIWKMIASRTSLGEFCWIVIEL